ncbi:hypothetical protein HBNXHr_2678 [Halorhabdus sp. BNX81]|nr:hypothetical protein HBNXHr_2678 [Halorhabdus sp. BNX81]
MDGLVDLERVPVAMGQDVLGGSRGLVFRDVEDRLATVGVADDRERPRLSGGIDLEIHVTTDGRVGQTPSSPPDFTPPRHPSLSTMVAASIVRGATIEMANSTGSKQ